MSFSEILSDAATDAQHALDAERLKHEAALRAEKDLLEHKLCETQCELEKAKDTIEKMGLCEKRSEVELKAKLEALQAVADFMAQVLQGFQEERDQLGRKVPFAVTQALARYESLTPGATNKV